MLLLSPAKFQPQGLPFLSFTKLLINESFKAVPVSSTATTTAFFLDFPVV